LQKNVDSLSGGHHSVRGDSFWNGCEPVRAFETTRGVRGSSESRSFGIMLGCAPTGRFCDLQRSLDYSWLVPHCLALSILEDLVCPTCGLCWWGPEGITVDSSTGLSVIVTNGDGTGVTDRRLRTRAQSYGWRSIGFFAANRLQHLFGRGHHTTYLIMDLNGLTFYLGSCQCSVIVSQD
jgi:hypothetical protein